MDRNAIPRYLGDQVSTGHLEVRFYEFAAEMPLDPGLGDDDVHNTAAGARTKAELFATFPAEYFLPRRATVRLGRP